MMDESYMNERTIFVPSYVISRVITPHSDGQNMLWYKNKEELVLLEQPKKKNEFIPN
jgi:hypothetical protein